MAMGDEESSSNLQLGHEHLLLGLPESTTYDSPPTSFQFQHPLAINLFCSKPARRQRRARACARARARERAHVVRPV